MTFRICAHPPTKDRSTRVPVVLEFHRWGSLDSGHGLEPSFEDFVLVELTAPAIGVPEHVTRTPVGRDRLTYLLDSFLEAAQL